jgi:hypothetical protein
MTLEEMETALKRYGFDNKDPLKAWLNAAMRDIESVYDWPFLETALVETEMAAGSNEITLPLHTTKVITVKDQTNIYKLKYYDIHKFERDIREPKEVGLPEIYYLISTNYKLGIWRVLEKPTKFELRVQLECNDMELANSEPGSTSIKWPHHMHYPVVLRAAMIALNAENEEDRVKILAAEYEKMLMSLMLKYGEREMDEPLTVADAQGYGHENPMTWVS